MPRMRNRTSPNRTSPNPVVARLSKEIIALSYRGCEDLIFGGEDAFNRAYALLGLAHVEGLSVSEGDLVKAAALLFSDDEEGFCDLFEDVAKRLADDLDPRLRRLLKPSPCSLAPWP